MPIVVTVTPNEKDTPAGKLADAELHFVDGPLDGLKLIGFSVWERRGGARNVTFPARPYTVNGERRSYALLRPIADMAAQDRVRDLVLDALARSERSEPEPLTEREAAPPSGRARAARTGRAQTRSSGDATATGV